MNNEIIGTLKEICSIQDINGFIKQEFIIEILNPYNEDWKKIPIKFEIHNKKIDMDFFNIKDELKISFNIRGREWINTQGISVYFNSFVCWKIQKLQDGYVIPTNEKSPHIQHQFNFPPANEVFGD